MDINNEYGCLEIHNELLKLMKYFHEFCVKNEIKYSMIGGSLLGTVRDNGFIPWDDDIDIMVERKSLKTLIKLIEGSNVLKIKRTLWVYRVQMNDSVVIKNGYTPTLDLFMVDNMPDNIKERQIHLFKLYALQGMIKEKPDYSRFTLKNKVLLFSTYYLGKLFSQSFKMNLYDKIAQSKNEVSTQYKAIFYAQFHQLKFLYPKDMMERVSLHKFENIEVYITDEYDSVLTMTYGDYMTPPKKKERKPIHS